MVCKGKDVGVLMGSLLGLSAWGLSSSAVFADEVTRVLPSSINPGASFTVSIIIDVPPTGYLALEDAIPEGWSDPFNISSGGVWDGIQGEVKWLYLPYLGPIEVSYELTPPIDVTGELCCFTGVTNYYGSGGNQPIVGDQCVGTDCDQNGIFDACDMDCGDPGGECDVDGCGGAVDDNGNGLPDGCECVEHSECPGDGDFCTWDHCDVVCISTPILYGDVDHNGARGVYDIFCILNGFDGDFSVCSFEDDDLAPCGGDGTIGVFDLFAVLNSFGGEDPCCGGSP